MHENQYNGTGYEQPRDAVLCNECERNKNLRHVEPAEAYWDGPNQAYCDRHGVLDEDDFETMEL